MPIPLIWKSFTQKNYFLGDFQIGHILISVLTSDKIALARGGRKIRLFIYVQGINTSETRRTLL